VASFFDLRRYAIWARLDRVVQARIDAALVRFAATGHGDVKSLKDRPGELRLRVGKWRVFSASNHPISFVSSALTTGVKLTDQQLLAPVIPMEP
jgi:putative component of toxin-antitoxin plasmid stabilization module